MKAISDQALRDYFIGWQCRLRQMAMRDFGGRPTPGIQPRVVARSGTILAPAVTVLLIVREPKASTVFLKHQIQRCNEPQRSFEAGVAYLGGEHYQQPEVFSDELTAVFGGNSRIAESMLKEKEVLLEFAQFSQSFRLSCRVRRLNARHMAREASLWEARIFNPRVPNDATVLGFRPDWRNASADPMPQGS